MGSRHRERRRMDGKRKAPHSVPLDHFKGSPLMWCKGLKIVALKIETIEAQRWCRCEERSSLQQLSLQCGQ